MCKTIKQRVKFNPQLATVYDLFADSKKHSAVTGRKATISRKIGRAFSIGGTKFRETMLILFRGNEQFRLGDIVGFPKGFFPWQL